MLIVKYVKISDRCGESPQYKAISYEDSPTSSSVREKTDEYVEATQFLDENKKFI